MMLKNLTIRKTKELLLKKEMSTVDLINLFFEQIDKKDEEINAYLQVFKKGALSDAKKIDQAIADGQTDLPLLGAPVAIKDNILVYGKKATSASKILKNFTAPYSATVVKKIKKKGGIVLGRANMDEFAMGSSTENSAFGVTKNPYDLKRVSGGSSGGPAAAVAADMAVFGLGSDTGGSVRQPAAFCGLVGLKPTYGSVSRYGLMSMASSLDQISPFAKNLEDAQAVFSVISGKDKLDATSLNYKYEPKLENVKKLKIGVVKEFFGEGLDKEISDKLEELIKKLARQGIEIVEISMPHFEYVLACYYVIMSSEVSSNMARYDGVRYGLSKRDELGMWNIFFNSRKEGFGDEVKRRIMLGTYALSAGYYDAYYLQAQKVRRLIADDFKKAFSRVDVILGPTTPTTAFEIGKNSNDPLKMYLEDIYTVPVNLAGLPAMSMPCGCDKKGLPIGVHLIANHFSEAKLFSLGKLIEEIL